MKLLMFQSLVIYLTYLSIYFVNIFRITKIINIFVRLSGLRGYEISPR